MIIMKAFHQEKLLPALISSKKEDHKIAYSEFTGTINVNQLKNKPVHSLNLKLEEFEEPKNERGRKIFNSFKQEQHYRLNREHKLKVNEEISNYLRNSKITTVNVGTKVNIKNEKDQIKDAAKQLDEINYILEHNKRYPPKKSDEIRKKIDGLSFLDGKINKTHIPSESNLKHMCTKGLRNKLTHYNATNADKKLRSMENKKGHFSTPDVLNATAVLSKITSQRNKKSIKNAIEALNSRLSNSKEKLLKEYEDSLKRSKEKITEMESFKSKKAPKYKSIKDVKLDDDKMKEFKDEIKAKTKLAEDPKEMKILYKNDIFLSQDESENQFERKDFPEKYKKFLKTDEDLNDLKILPQFEAKQMKNDGFYTIKSPKKETANVIPEINLQKLKPFEKLTKKDEILNNLFQTKDKAVKSPKNATKSPKSNDVTSKAVGNDPETNNLEKSILSSDYLSKEFHMEIGNFENNKGDNIVNWADKYKVTQPKKWSKDLEYFLS